MTDHDAAFDALTKQLVEAGLLQTFTDDDDDEAMRLTPEGERVTQQLAMTDGDGQDKLMGPCWEAIRNEKTWACCHRIASGCPPRWM